MKKAVKKMIRDRGPEATQEWIDDLLENEKMSKEDYDSAARQIRIHKK
jgi:hypothetical protein